MPRPEDEIRARQERLEEALLFVERTVDGLAEELGSLAGRLAALERRIAGAERRLDEAGRAEDAEEGGE